jgi:pyruvate carboxylase
MNGKLGIPEGGFPEPLRTRVLKGKAPLIKEGERPGQQMKVFNYDVEGQNLSLRTAVPLYPERTKKYDTNFLDFDDIISYSLYPEVYTQFLQHRGRYGDTSMLPT